MPTPYEQIIVNASLTSDNAGTSSPIYILETVLETPVPGFVALRKQIVGLNSETCRLQANESSILVNGKRVRLSSCLADISANVYNFSGGEAALSRHFLPSKANSMRFSRVPNGGGKCHIVAKYLCICDSGSTSDKAQT
jgi:hypothetical protein